MEEPLPPLHVCYGELVTAGSVALADGLFAVSQLEEDLLEVQLSYLGA